MGGEDAGREIVEQRPKGVGAVGAEARIESGLAAARWQPQRVCLLTERKTRSSDAMRCEQPSHHRLHLHLLHHHPLLAFSSLGRRIRFCSSQYLRFILSQYRADGHPSTLTICPTRRNIPAISQLVLLRYSSPPQPPTTTNNHSTSLGTLTSCPSFTILHMSSR